MRMWLAVAFMLPVITGCGASLRMVHQGNSYFEHCHAEEYDDRISGEVKRACWAAWLEHYQLGQGAERLAYARSRVAAIESGERVERLPGMRSGVVDSTYTAAFLTIGEEEGASEISAPNSAVHATPVSNMEASESVAPARVPDPPTVLRSTCASVCTPRWETCMQACEGGRASCGLACETEHRTCARGCF